MITTFYWIPAYTYGTLLSSTGCCISLWYFNIFYWPTSYPYIILLILTISLPIPMILYCQLLAHCLYLLYSTIIYWLPAYTYGIYYLLLAPCLSIWNSTTFYWPTDYPYGTLLSSTGPLTISLVLSYPFLAYPYRNQLSSTGPLPISMVLYYLLLAPFLSLWYHIIFYWLPEFPFGTLLIFYWPTAYTYDTVLHSTGSLPIHRVLYYLLLTPSSCLLHIALVLFYLLLAHCLYLWYSTFSTGPLPIPIVLY